MADEVVIDADAHVNPPPSFWREYLPASYRDRAPVLEEGDEVDYIVFEGDRRPFSRANSQAGTRPEAQKDTGRVSEARLGGWDPKARLDDMDVDGIDKAVIFGGGPLASQDPDLYLVSFHAYNAWLSDFCSVAPDRLLGIAYIPMFDVGSAIDEIEWANAHELRGVAIPPYAPGTRPQGVTLNANAAILYADPDGERSYADPEFNPFWERAEALGMPVHVHLGASRSIATGVDGRFRTQMRSKLAMAEVVVHFVMTGILPDHPGLRLVSVEGGVGWLAFAAEYLDNTWHKHRHSTGTPITVEPSTYMDRQVYATFLEDAAGVLTRDLKGAQNIMWSSDYPHSETTWPNSRASIDRSLVGLSASDRRRILSENARRLYQLN
jgi:predicted TIM-barrel fold metal-dependent hydrolase